MVSLEEVVVKYIIVQVIGVALAVSFLCVETPVTCRRSKAFPSFVCLSERVGYESNSFVKKIQKQSHFCCRSRYDNTSRVASAIRQIHTQFCVAARKRQLEEPVVASASDASSAVAGASDRDGSADGGSSIVIDGDADGVMEDDGMTDGAPDAVGVRLRDGRGDSEGESVLGEVNTPGPLVGGDDVVGLGDVDSVKTATIRPTRGPLLSLDSRGDPGIAADQSFLDG